MKFLTKEIKARIRELSLAAERNGRPADEILELIYQLGLFKLFVPNAMNGSMTALPEAVRMFEEASYIDGSFGWLVTIGSGGGYFSSIFDKEVSRRLFTQRNAVVAGSGHVGGSARKIDGGYSVSGSWKFCSGAEYATIFTANCMSQDGTVRSFIFTPDQVTVHKDWDAYGLRATGSHTISVSDTIVADDMTFDISSGDRHYIDPIFDYPFLPFAQASFAAVNVGICRHFLEEARLVLGSSHTPDNIIARQEEKLTEEANKFHVAVERSWELSLHNDNSQEAAYIHVGQLARKVTATALGCAQSIYPHLGLTAAIQSTSLNRCWRDLHTSSQHILIRPEGSTG